MKLLKKIGLGLLVAGAAIGPVSASVITDAQTALTAAGTDASTVGGYVVAAVAVIAGVGIILSMVRKV
ncbi:MAG: major capsid protein [Methylobacter sp.]